MNMKEKAMQFLATAKRRGQAGVFGQMNGLVVGLIVLVAFVGLGLTLLGQMKSQTNTLLNGSTAAINASFDTGSTLVGQIPGWAGIVFIVVIIVIVIGLLYMLQGGGRGKRG